MTRSVQKLVLAATVLSATLAIATPAFAAGSDDTTAGAIPLVSATVTGTLDVSQRDEHDYYSVMLIQGQRFTARLSGSKGTDFNMYVYHPKATRPQVDSPIAYAWDLGYPDYLYDSNSPDMGFEAPQTGTYFLEIADEADKPKPGTYTVAWRVGVAPSSVSLNKSQTITIGSTVKLTGTVRSSGGVGIPGETVELLALGYNESDDLTFKRLSSSRTTTSGAFSFSVKPDRMTFYLAVSQGLVPGYVHWPSQQRAIKVRHAITKPAAPTTVARGKAFAISGYVTPKHSAGSPKVRVEAYLQQRGGVWPAKPQKTITTTSGVVSGQTRYRTTTAMLPSSGTWKLVAKTSDDGFHAASASAPAYVKVP